MPTALEEMDRILAITAQVIISDLTEQARAELADADLFPLVQIIEVLDDRTCLLCEYMDGMTMDRRMPGYERWARPPHINCRRTYGYISAEEMQIDEEGRPVPVEPTFVEPPASLVDKHGHFIRDPDKYAPLRIPAQPEGRDFVFKRIKDPATGRLVSVMEWRTRMYEIPGLRPDTIRIPA